MDALLMCGGRGNRLESAAEKPLYRIDGVPMADRVRAALAESGVETTHGVVSPQAPATRDHLAGDLPLIETPGEGYVADLGAALERVDSPVLTVAADLPLLDGAAVDAVLAAHDGGSLSVRVPADLKRALGGSLDHADDPVPTGVNVVADDAEDTMYVTENPRLAVNVNRRRDARVAEALLAAGVPEVRP